MAVDPLHRIGRAERQAAGQHLVECHAKRIEVGAGIDRAVHPSGLLGRHIGERARDDLEQVGRLTLARQTRGNAEPGEPRSSVGAIHQDIGRLDVLVDEGSLVGVTYRRSDADGEAQEAARLHRSAHDPLQRLAAGILEQQRGSAVFAGKRKRPRSPCGVERVPQFIFVGEALENDRRRAIRRGQHRQHRPAAFPAVRAPPAVEDAFAILPQEMEIA